jgi:hypothetical protein
MTGKIYTSQVDTIITDLTRIKGLLAEFEANTPNNEPGPAKVARRRITEVRKKLDELDRQLGNATAPGVP